MCSLLLSHGADPTIPNCHSKTALDLSTSDQNRECLDSEGVRLTVCVSIHASLSVVSPSPSACCCCCVCVCVCVCVLCSGVQGLPVAECGRERRPESGKETAHLHSPTHHLPTHAHTQLCSSETSLNLPLPLSLSLSLSLSTHTHTTILLYITLQHCATVSKRKSLVELLIKRGADVNMKNKM